MNTPLGLIGKNRPMTAISPHAAQAELITTAAQEIAAVNSMVNASRWQNPISKFYAERKLHGTFGQSVEVTRAPAAISGS